MWRARKPRSWWVTPEWVALKEVSYAMEMRMWQAGGAKKGAKPKPPKVPEDQAPKFQSAGDLKAKRRAQAEQLRRRRAQRASGTS